MNAPFNPKPPTDELSRTLIAKRDKAQEEASNAQKALAAICVAVGHDMRDDGHDSHYSWERCARCNISEKC